MPAPRLTKAVASLSTAAVLLSTLFALPAAAAQDPAINAGAVAPPSNSNVTPPAEASSRFVVKFKPGSPGTAAARAEAYGQAARTSGVSVKELRATATGATVVQTSETLTSGGRASVVASLRGQNNVEYVAPDTFVRPAATVSDPLFQYQWDISDSITGMRVPGAWDVTIGRGATVAVIDTGITGHSDLAANIVSGYDFISDPGISNDGDGRDANATDAGDYCNGAPSSWHGTHVAGTIAAAANNGRGIAGIAYGAKVQSLRALGACGGYMSDIADAVVWAAGGAVAGLPANPTPAQVINMSLGGSGQCEAYFQSALDFAASKGTVVVAAAGG
jgi:serine protease